MNRSNHETVVFNLELTYRFQFSNDTFPVFIDILQSAIWFYSQHFVNKEIEVTTLVTLNLGLFPTNTIIEISTTGLFR